MIDAEKLLGRLLRQSLGSGRKGDGLIPQVDSPDLARQFYAVSLMAIEVDTDAERTYLRHLQDRLKLDGGTVRELHDQFAD